MRIRELASTPESPRIAGAAVGSRVAIWDFASRECLGVHDTVFGIGGRRLAIDPSGETFVAAAYARKGLAAYDALTGSERWRRKDLRGIQFTAFSRDGTRVYCGQAGRSLAILDAITGEGAAPPLPGIQEVWDSTFAPLQLREPARNARPHVVDEDGRTVISWERVTWSVLDAAFGRKQVCVSEPGGPVRCFSLATGRERWRYKPRSAHVIALAANASGSKFLGVEYSATSSEAPNRLVRLDAATGNRIVVTAFPRDAAVVFCDRARFLALADGNVLDTIDGSHARPFIIPDIPEASG